MHLPAAARLVLIRHAESVGNAEGIMQGGGEYPLSAAGRTQALAAAEDIAAWPVAWVIGSDLGRAMETARLVTGRLDGVEPRLRERGAGVWEGRRRIEIEQLHPGSLEDDALRPEGFEPESVVVARMRAGCAELLARPGLTLAFTHGAVLRVLARELGEGGGRFSHLEGLVLGEGFALLGRIGPLGVANGGGG